MSSDAIPVFELAEVSVLVEASRITLFGEELQRALLSSAYRAIGTVGARSRSASEGRRKKKDETQC